MFPKKAYRILQEIVGKDYISCEPEICKAYTLRQRGFHNSEARILGTQPVCVILPANTEQVQKILSVAHQYKIKFVPASTFWFTQSGPRTNNTLFIDLKRLNHLEIDSKNLYAVVGPGVIFAQLQAEALRCGLYTMVPGGGSQASVIANHLSWGYSPLTYRVGMPNRRILGLEWILPTGELVRMGSLASCNSPFWGEGVGPDLRGIIRGSIGWFGSLGIVTKMAVRLFPFQPDRLIPTGITPDTYLKFPENRIKWYSFTCPNEKSFIEMIYEIGHAEIAAAVMRVPIAWRYIARAKSKEDFWKKWKNYCAQNRNHIKEHILRILLIGYTSESQLQYEEKVLMAIAKKYGAIQRRARQVDQSWIQSADAVSMWLLTGAFMSVTGQVDSIDSGYKTAIVLTKLKKKYTPPLVPDGNDPGWFQSNELGHCGYLEVLNYWDPQLPEQELHKIDEYYNIQGPKALIDCGALSFFIQTNSPLSLDSPCYGPNYDTWARKIKDALDPNGCSNPPGILDSMDKVIEEAPWLKTIADWKSKKE